MVGETDLQGRSYLRDNFLPAGGFLQSLSECLSGRQEFCAGINKKVEIFRQLFGSYPGEERLVREAQFRDRETSGSLGKESCSGRCMEETRK